MNIVKLIQTEGDSFMEIKKNILTSNIMNLKVIKKKKIWRYKKGVNISNYLSELEFIELINNKEIDKDTLVTNSDLKKWVTLDNTIYRFYLK